MDLKGTGISHFKEYDLFIDDLAEPLEGSENLLAIRDLGNYVTLAVRAMVFKSGDDLPDSDRLWLRDNLGRRAAKPWRIRIIEELPFETLFIKNSKL